MQKYRNRFETEIRSALEKPVGSGNESEAGLRVDPIAKPDMSGWFQRSLTAKGLLQNGQREKYKIQIEIDGTCGPDSILQALSWLYIDDAHFRKAVDERIRKSPDADLARFSATLAQKGDKRQIYRWRMEMLSEYCFVLRKDDVMNFQCASINPVNIAVLIAPLFPTKTSITTCKCRIKKKFAALPIDDTYLKEFGFKKLQTAIDRRNNHFVDEESLCKHCGQRSSKIYAFGDIVFIIVRPSVGNRHPVWFPLEIQDTIVLKDQKYSLVCVSDITMPGHARINCLRGKNEWYQYDDLLKKSTLLAAKESKTDFLMYKRVA